MKGRVFSILLLMLAAGRVQGQIPQVSGFIYDEESGEAISGAVVRDSSALFFTYSNQQGFYSLGVNSGKRIILISAAGYEQKRLEMSVYSALELNCTLNLLDVMENDTHSNLQNTVYDNRSGYTSPLASQVENMPALMCEQDPVKFLQYLPGVMGGIEGLSGMYVRGGNSDQNLMTMDGLQVYGNGHLFGFLSYFNPDVVRDIQFYRGALPARYGGRAGSVTDVSLKDGNKDDAHGSFSSDPLTFKFNMNGPLNAKGTTTASFGMRRSWIDLLLRKGGNNYLFYNLHDYNGKVVFRPSDKTKVAVWAYNGRDKFALKTTNTQVDTLNREITQGIENSIIWQNTLAGINYSHKFSSRHFGSFIAGMSRYRYKYPLTIDESILSDTTFDHFKINYKQDVSITDITGKANLEYALDSRSSLRYGAEFIHHYFVPSTEYIKLVSNNNTGLDSLYGAVNKQSTAEASAYAEWEKNLSTGLKVNIGGRVWVYATREKVYVRPEPRIMISQVLEGNRAIKAGFSIANQGINQLSSVNGNLPSDVWFPSTGNFKPQQCIQTTLGYFRPWKYGVEFSGDAYYKWMNGITDLKNPDPGDLTLNYWENLIAQGKGTAYGLELLAIKKTGRLNGLISYTWSQSKRTIEEINFGKTFPFRWDRRHKGVIQAVYHVTANFKVNMALVIMTGHAVTVPTGKYIAADGSFVYDFSEKNNYRMPLYNRIDLGFSKVIHPEDRGYTHQYWGMNFYNMLNWKNPMFIDLSIKASKPNRVVAISYFPIIPSIFYKWEF